MARKENENPSPSTCTDIFEKCRRFNDDEPVIAAGLYPFFRPVASALDTEVVVDGRRCVMLGSNNYLGLANDDRVKDAAARAITEFGSGCTGSRLLNGTLVLHQKLEEELASFMNKEAALVFSTGYQTNLGIISALVMRDDIVLVDRNDHASIIDGCRLSYGKLVKFDHNNAAALEEVLQRLSLDNNYKGRLVIVDGVFSMEGDVIDLPKFLEATHRWGARLVLDDAHAIGVLGDGGRGTGEHFGILDQVDLVMGTFSKSFGGLGGFVAGDRDVIKFIKHFGRSIVFSASLAPGSVAGVLKALEIIQSEPERRLRLWENIRLLKNGLESLGFETGNSSSAVIPVIIGEDMETFRFWKALFDRGVYANVAIPPAVPKGQALIRTSCMATHTREQLERALEAFAAAGREVDFAGGGGSE